MSVLGVDHTTLPPVTDAASSATSFLSRASTNSDQGLSLDSDQNGLLTKTSALDDHAIIPPVNMSVLGGGIRLSPPTEQHVRARRSCRGFADQYVRAWRRPHDPPAGDGCGQQCNELPVCASTSDQALSPDSDQNGLLTKTSALGNDHAVNSSNNMSVLGVEHALVPPETGAAGSARSFLSGASTNIDQGLSLDSDQNGLLTKTSALGNDHAIDPSNNMSVL